MKPKEICCGGDILFEPYPPHNIFNDPLVKVYHGEKGNHWVCLGKCGNPSLCPFCTGELEIGWVICPVCKFVVGEGFRDREGEITIQNRGADVGPSYNTYRFSTPLIVRGED